MADYSEPVLTTGNDDELAAAISASRHEDMKYLGIGLYGDRQVIDSLTGKFTLWR